MPQCYTRESQQLVQSNWEIISEFYDASNRRLGIKAKKCQYEGVIVLAALYGAEAWGMRTAERSKDEVFDKFGWSIANG